MPIKDEPSANVPEVIVRAPEHPTMPPPLAAPAGPPTKADPTPPRGSPVGPVAKASAPTGETLDHAIVRMYEDGYSLGEIIGQIRKWHPGWSNAQVAAASEKAARVFLGLPPSKDDGKDVVSQAIHDVMGMPKSNAVLFFDLAAAIVTGDPKRREKAIQDLLAVGENLKETLQHPMRDPFATALLLAPIGRFAMTADLRLTYDAAVRKLTPEERKVLLEGADPKKFRYTDEQKRTVAKLYEKIGEQGAKDYKGREYPSTAQHAEGVATTAKGIAKELGYTKRQQRVVFESTRPHDVGKGSSATIRRLVKEPRQLAPAERDIVGEHTARGERLLRRLGIDDPHTLHNAAEHHSRAAPAERPALTNIVQVADLYDAMIRPRSYERDFPYGSGKMTGRTYLTQAEAFSELDDLVKLGKLDRNTVAALKQTVRKAGGPPTGAASIVIVEAATIKPPQAAAAASNPQPATGKRPP